MANAATRPEIAALAEMNSTELTWAYHDFCASIGRECEGSADELLCELIGAENKDKAAIAWLKAFIAAWEAMEAAA